MTMMEAEKCSAEKCAAELDQHHLCAFDSFLHATVCSKLGANNQTKAKHMNQAIPTQALKLKTSLLNQLNPNLTPEQRLARKLNDVEKWMRETAIHEAKIKANDDKNILSPINVDKLSSNATNARHKKPFNKEILITKKSKSSPHRSKQQKDAINNIKNQAVLEILGDTSECENLISMSDEDEQEQTVVDVSKNEQPTQEGSEDASKSSSVRFVHIHHHFYHFENNAKSS